MNEEELALERKRLDIERREVELMKREVQFEKVHRIPVPLRRIP